ncbi:MAG: phenylacetate-CoA oxygenase subunit PaaI [Xanthomonadales bacterium]|nr:phenylacetate-CoA oxygenase subunit PaaI [Xanthomonadales bacterium]
MKCDLSEYLLRFADSSLVLSQQLGAWCGHGPALEEDMALTNVALDLLGQARLWFDYVVELSPGDATEDSLAHLRDSSEFRSLLLVERPNGSYADTLARQFVFDAWHSLALRELIKSADERIASIALKSSKEVAYHLRRSSDLVVRLGDGTKKSHEMMQAAIDDVWPFSGEAYIADSLDQSMASQGIGFDPALLRDEWLTYVREVLDAATLEVPPEDAWMQTGGKRGLHGEHLSKILAEMQVLQRTYPGAQW